MLSSKFLNLFSLVTLSITAVSLTAAQDVPTNAATPVASDVPVASDTFPSAETVPLTAICQQIQDAISSASGVFGPCQEEYNNGVSHWQSTNMERPECVVEPGTPEDVATILSIVGETRTPFAVKGGGHSPNPGFSSTTGVLVAMSRFNQITYNPDAQTADVGAGLLWDDVYKTLVPQGVNVVGARVSGIGVAGFTLGGGYSFKTNQYGLAIDTVKAMELVKPTGEVAVVTAESDPELFSALKGGLNNFGIVTRFTFAAHPQGDIWGGSLIYTAKDYDAIGAAIAKFSSTAFDPKAAALIIYVVFAGQHLPTVVLYYEGSEPPAGVFDDFLAIPSIAGSPKTQNFVDFFSCVPDGAQSYGLRGAFHPVPLETYTEELLSVITEEAKPRNHCKSGLLVTYAIEPFLANITTHMPANSSSYPISRSLTTSFSPFNLYFAWTLPIYDDEMIQAITDSAQRIQDAAISQGQGSIIGDNASVYPNYAAADTPIEMLWGDNVEWMSQVKKRVDPQDIMGLTGGFKIPLPATEAPTRRHIENCR